MTTTPWAHLPNAKHIDAVLADVTARPDAWTSARVTATVCTAMRISAWDVARDEAWVETKGLRREEAWSPFLALISCDAAWDAARDVVAALIAWDDSAALLDQPPDVLRAMIDLADAPVKHQAVLLLPYTIVCSATKQVTPM